MFKTVVKIISHLHHMLHVLLKFCKAFFNGQQTPQSICLWVLKSPKRQKMRFLLKSTWTNLFYLLQEHLQSWFDDLQVASELSHNILQGILQDHVLKIEVLSQKNLFSEFSLNYCSSGSGSHLVIVQKIHSREKQGQIYLIFKSQTHPPTHPYEMELLLFLDKIILGGAKCFYRLLNFEYT